MENELMPLNPFVKKYAPLVKNGRAIDIGTGNGSNALFLASNGFKVDAIDINKDAIEGLKKRSKELKIELNAKKIDIRKFPFNKKYDLILAIQSLIFMKKSEFNTIISKIKKSLNKGGVAIISSFTTADASFEQFAAKRKPVGKNTFYSKGSKQYWNFLEKNELKKCFTNKKFEILSHEEFIKKDNPHEGTDYPHQHGIARIAVKLIK
ncbi:MAG: methyltransferase domain-containing protein [Candidatus Berkelbacteria bacterium]|nr:methyltransferase domain-containing protein [Candidatus Berkelbacteria bacterium]